MESAAQEIQKAGFAPAKRCPRRIIASIQGPVKCGKTRLALTAPKPCGYIAVEVGGDEGVVDQFIPDGQDVYDGIQSVQIRMATPAFVDRSAYPLNKDGDKLYDAAVAAENQIVADAAYNKFLDAYYTSLANFRTTIVDTGSDLWELLRMAFYGKLEKVPQLAYTALNKAYDKLLDDAFSYQGNVIFTHHLKRVWESYTDNNGKEQRRASDQWEMAGYAGIKKKVQAVIELWREDLTEPNINTGRMVKFNGIIVDSRHSPDAMGEKFEDDFTFADIGKKIISGTSERDWQ